MTAASTPAKRKIAVMGAGAVVYVATKMAGPGHLRHHGRGELLIKPSSQSAAVAQALGAAGVPTQFSSTAQDPMRGKPTEIDHLNGRAARRGATLGVPTPANDALWTLVKLAESARPATPDRALLRPATPC